MAVLASTVGRRVSARPAFACDAEAVDNLPVSERRRARSGLAGARRSRSSAKATTGSVVACGIVPIVADC